MRMRSSLTISLLWIMSSCIEPEQILHYPEPPAPLPYDGKRVLQVVGELPDYLVPGQRIDIAVLLSGDGVPLPDSMVRVTVPQNSNSSLSTETGLSSGLDSQVWSLDLVTNSDGLSLISVTVGQFDEPVTMKVSDLCSRCVVAPSAEELDISLDVRLRGLGKLQVQVTNSDLMPAASIEAYLFRTQAACAPLLDVTGQPIEEWLDPRNPPSDALASDTAGIETVQTAELGPVDTGQGYGLLVLGLSSEDRVLSAACVDVYQSTPIDIPKDATSVMKINLVPLAPNTNYQFDIHISFGKFIAGEHLNTLTKKVKKLADDVNGPAGYVVSALDLHFGWGLVSIEGPSGVLADRCLSAVDFALSGLDGTGGNPDLDLILAEAEKAGDALLHAADSLTLSGRVTLGPVLLDGVAMGNLTLSQATTAVGTIDLAAVPFQFMPESTVSLAFDPKGPLWTAAELEILAPRTYWGALVTSIFNLLIRPSWSSNYMTMSGGDDADGVDGTYSSLFSCELVVAALDRADCPVSAGDPRVTQACESDGLWVGPVRYSRSVLLDGCFSVVDKLTTSFEAGLLELAAMTAQSFYLAGAVSAEVCSDDTTLCGFASSGEWDLVMEGEPWAAVSSESPAVGASRVLEE